MSIIEKLEKRAYTTYNSRVISTKRLTRLNNRWNAALIAFAVATTVASIGLLVNRDMYGRGGDALMVALSVLSLVVSLVVSSVNYGTRAKAMEANYKQIQALSFQVENLRLGVGEQRSAEELLALQRDYLYAVDSSENHSEGDYLRTLPETGLSKTDLSKAELTRRRRILHWEIFVSAAPLVSLVAPVLVLVPFAVWFVDGL